MQCSEKILAKFCFALEQKVAIVSKNQTAETYWGLEVKFRLFLTSPHVPSGKGGEVNIPGTDWIRGFVSTWVIQDLMMESKTAALLGL
jgi:hypothetical protein